MEFLGLNTHDFPCGLEHNSSHPEETEKLFLDLGVKWLRAEVYWHSIETQEGQYNFGPTDKIVDFARKHNLHILFILAKTPSFYVGEGKHHLLPGSCVRGWRKYVRTMVERYGDTIRHWNIWNEPNLTQFWDDDSVDGIHSVWNFINRVLKPAYEEIKSANSEALVCGPELSSSNAGGESPRTWLREIHKAGITFDILTHHQYDASDDPGKRVKELKKFYNFALKECGYPPGTELWLTETGWQKPKFDDGKIVRNMENIVHEIIRSPEMHMVKKLFWFCLREPGIEKDAVKWGLLDEHDNPRAAYNTFKEILHSAEGDGNKTFGEKVKDRSRK